MQKLKSKIKFSYWSPTALKRPDRSKQCHCLQFAKCFASLLHYYKSFQAFRERRSEFCSSLLLQKFVNFCQSFFKYVNIYKNFPVLSLYFLLKNEKYIENDCCTPFLIFCILYLSDFKTHKLNLLVTISLFHSKSLNMLTKQWEKVFGCCWFCILVSLSHSIYKLQSGSLE